MKTSKNNKVSDYRESIINQCKSEKWKPFSKQLLVCSGVWTSIFLTGLSVGAPTVYIPQIRQETNNTEIITDDIASWLSSVHSFSGFPFVIILIVVTKFFGRKKTFLIAILGTLAAFTVLYCSTHITHILISNIMMGMFIAQIISIMILTEYTSPKFRGIFLTVKVATFYWGIWVSNAIGTFFHWKNISFLGIICSLLILVTIFFWPESPYWLASKARFDECAAAHRYLKGCEEDAEKELEALINSQKEYIASCGTTKLSANERVADLFKTVSSKEFYKPTALAIITGTLGISCGKLVYAVYALDILKNITNSTSAAYVAMLFIDGITVLSMYGGSILSKYSKRRTLLLVASSIGVSFLFILSLYLYLVKLNIITNNKYVSVSLLVAFSIAVSCGPMVMSFSVFAELLPMRSRNLSGCILALSGKVMTALSLKCSPFMFRNYGIHGTFLIFGVSSLLIILFLCKYLPETKDKTLQEITDNIKCMKSNNNEVTSKLLVVNDRA